ncbi:DUF1800 domain-containing protein [Taibaiella chishuiensis]|uniref:Uncharacterized protein (DUF1800 family) n=1 Tax=Taibaiella chishuiensis TaxID=1434707 RepID=A0A2P8CV84_9BACT|nr:DUF1800 domain-containing protein [Taibaiella chishuiensis]PSK88875.1 uncharacterized protein (DUF1800 family) [Taibaiella chishuiensis]
MDSTKQRHNQHLLWRAGFGPAAADLDRLRHINPDKLYKQLEKQAKQKPVPFDAASDYIKTALLQAAPAMEGQLSPEDKKRYTTEQRRLINRQSNEDIRKLSLLWLDEMAKGEGQLREKLALFWHGHFACRVNNSLYQQMLLQDIREHAFGNFGDLLKAVSKSASMLTFLNNQQNRKKRPNENFAREVLELFTMGRGHYTETDIKESARAFTGWGFEKNGSFVFRPKIHDEDNKTFLGQSGAFTGDDILDIILKQRQTAVYITEKIYRYFVNDRPDAARIEWLAGRFYAGNYHIPGLMRDIFTSDWFYDEENIGAQIKSPVAYMTGIRRLLPITIQNEEVQVLLQRLLGQWLFNPPNVAGWPGGTAWIDSSSLMLRLRIPGLVKNEESINIKPKGDDDVQMGRKEMLETGTVARPRQKKPGGGYQILAQIDWQQLDQPLERVSQEALYPTLEQFILQTPPGSADAASLQKLVVQTDRPAYIHSLVIAFMSTPEYQLC